MTLPLADVRVLAVEQFGAGPWGDAPARRPRRRGDQDRGPGSRRRRRPLRAALPGGRGLAVLRDVQPQQEERLARPAHRRRAARSSKTSCAESDAVFSNLRGDQPGQARAHLRRPRARSTRGSSAARSSGFGMTGPRAAEAGYDYIMQAHGRLDEPHRRPRRAAHQERALARRPVRRLRRGDRDARAAPGAARRDGVGLRLRRLAVRDRAARAHVRRHLGGERTGTTPPRLRELARTPRSCPFQTFATADGWITIACAKQKFWERPVHGARPRRPARGSALRRLRGARRATATSSSPILGADFAHASRPRTGSTLLVAGRRPARAGQRRRRGARGSAGAGARRRRRARAPDARHRPPGRARRCA